MLAQLRNATKIIRYKLSSRRRRKASLAIYEALTAMTNSDIARDVAIAMTGVAPEPWLTVSEAKYALQDLGVKVYEKLLYRLFWKAKKSMNGVFIVCVNSKGRWDGVDSPEIKNPLAILSVRVSGARHFKVSRFRSEV